jgi:pilus assembly protein CpaB
MKQKFVLIAAAVFGLIAALLSRAWLNSKQAEYDRQMAKLFGQAVKVEVVAAARSLPKGTVLALADIGGKQVYESAVRGHVVKREDHLRIIGRKLEQTIEAGAPIFWSDIEGGDTGYKGLSHDIRSGMRAVSIAVSGASAVSGMVRPNDTVDVLGTFIFGAADDPIASELVTLTVLQNVTVLATGMETAKTINPLQRSSGGYSSVTLEVTPREAEVLVFAQQMKGRLSLTLRNPTDVAFLRDLPRVDFQRIEAELRKLNDYRQSVIRELPLE